MQLYRETDKRGSASTVPQPTRPASSLLVPEGPAALSSGGYSAAGTSGMDRARERILLGSLTNSHKFKEDGMMKKVCRIPQYPIVVFLTPYADLQLDPRGLEQDPPPRLIL